MLYDRDIREYLFEFLDTTYGKNRIIEEKQIGKSRADVMMVTEDALWGIEIKSDADTYARLDRQVKDYNRFFDYNIAVVGASHAQSIEDHVPDYWGIITVEEPSASGIPASEITASEPSASGIPDLYLMRMPQRNPKREKAVLFRNQVSFLWRPELANIQKINGMHKYASLSKANLIKKIIDTVPQDELKRQVCDELMQRDYTTIAAVLEEYRNSHGKKK